ncbi:hypothetical protein AAE478_004417 [Parahypoxylon ruwenzoriense]
MTGVSSAPVRRLDIAQTASAINFILAAFSETMDVENHYPMLGDHSSSTASTQHPETEVMDQGGLAIVSSRKPVPAPSSNASYPQRSESLPWRPPYLQRRLLSALLLAFVVLITSIQILLSISRKNQGLTTSQDNIHYIWTYGPTAILSLILGVWNRVDFQAKMAAPWLNMSRGYASARRTLLLDYVSMLPPIALGNAIRNRDWLVACTTSVSLLLPVTIVVSTGLISLSSVRISMESYPITLASEFRDSWNNWGELHPGGSLPYCNMQGLLWNNFSYPDGVTSKYAYQSLNLSSLPPDTELRVIVDAFSADLECGPAALEINSTLRTDDIMPDPSGRFHQTFRVRSPECDITFSTYMLFNLDPYYFARLGSGSCTPSTNNEGSQENLDEMRLAFIFSNVTYHPFPDDDSLEAIGILEDPISIICKPTYAIKPSVLAQNGTDLLDISLPESGVPRLLRNIHPWDIVGAVYEAQRGSRSQFAYLNDGSFYPGKPWLLGASISTDPLTVDMLSFADREISETPIFDYAFFEKAMRGWWQQYAAFVAHGRLMQPASSSLNATASLNQRRLIVHDIAAQAMTGLLGASLLLGLLVCWMVPSSGYLPHNPYTIFGIASIIAPNSTVAQSLGESGWSTAQEMDTHLRDITCRSGIQRHFTILGAPSSDVPKKWKESSSRPRDKVIYPISLNPIARASSCVIIVAIIIAMEVLLQKSVKNAGLGLAGDDDHIHYLWTTLPAIILTLLSLNLSSIDFQTRSLVPYFNLQEEAAAERTVDLDLLDKMMPTAFITEVHIKSGTACAATLAAFAASILTILTGSLFDINPTPLHSVAQLRVTDSFSGNISFSRGLNDSNEAMIDKDTIISNLVLAGNQSYPRFTYENLAFPQYALQENEEEGIRSSGINMSTMSIEATLPAIRSRFSCKQYEQDDISLDISNSAWGTPGFSDLINSKNSYNCTGELSLEITVPDSDSDETLDTVIAGSMQSVVKSRGTSISSVCLVWAWGRVSKPTAQSDVSVENFRAMACNETLEVVDVAVRFHGNEFRIDPLQPPVPNETSARPSVCPIRQGSGVGGLPEIYENTLYEAAISQNPVSFSIDPFFALITTSRYAISNRTLGDPSQAQSVRDAILFHHGILRTQNLNFKYRNPAELTNATLSNPPVNISELNDASFSYSANVSDLNGPLRVIQQTIPTRILEALLTTILVLSIASWVMMPHANILPRSPTNIASAVALLAGGNLLDHIPRGDKGHPEGNGRLRFSQSTRFWMGWESELALPLQKRNRFVGSGRFGIFVSRIGGKLKN